MTQEQARKLAHDWYQCLVSQVNGRKPEEMRVLTEHNIAMLNLDSHKIPRQSAGGEDLTLWERVVLLVRAETDKVRGPEGWARYPLISDEEYKARMDGSTRWREPVASKARFRPELKVWDYTNILTPEQKRKLADAYYQGVYANLPAAETLSATNHNPETLNVEDDD